MKAVASLFGLIYLSNTVEPQTQKNMKEHPTTTSTYVITIGEGLQNVFQTLDGTSESNSSYGSFGILRI